MIKPFFDIMIKQRIKEGLAFFLIIFIPFLLYSFLPSPASSPSMDRKEKLQLIEMISDLLIKEYIFKDKAVEVSSFINDRFQRGDYDQCHSEDNFVEALNRHLYISTEDPHLRIACDPAIVHRISMRHRIDEREKDRSHYERITEEASSCFGFRKVEVMKGNIGYLDLSSFSGLKEALVPAAEAMTLLAETNAIIIDLRCNQGGSPFMLQILAGYFLSPETPLYSVKFRGTGEVRHYSTLPHIPDKQFYERKLYILTSRMTFSAAEGFAYCMQSLKRAVVIGEVTAGGAHLGSPRHLTGNFTIWVPIGRPIDPRTNSNWEKTGVKPDFTVPSEAALIKALSLASN